MEYDVCNYKYWEELETIETDRLVLRPLRYEDADDILRFAGDADTAYWAGMARLETRLDAFELINYSNYYSDQPQLGITLKGEDKVIGLVDIYQTDTDLYCLGYLISKEHQCKGYMTEAVKAVCDWFFERNSSANLVLRIRKDNPASRRVATKCGFIQDPYQTEWTLNRFGKPLDEFILYNPELLSDQYGDNPVLPEENATFCDTDEAILEIDRDCQQD